MLRMEEGSRGNSVKAAFLYYFLQTWHHKVVGFFFAYMSSVMPCQAEKLIRWSVCRYFCR